MLYAIAMGQITNVTPTEMHCFAIGLTDWTVVDLVIMAYCYFSHVKNFLVD